MFQSDDIFYDSYFCKPLLLPISLILLLLVLLYVVFNIRFLSLQFFLHIRDSLGISSYVICTLVLYVLQGMKRIINTNFVYLGKL